MSNLEDNTGYAIHPTYPVYTQVCPTCHRCPTCGKYGYNYYYPLYVYKSPTADNQSLPITVNCTHG